MVNETIPEDIGSAAACVVFDKRFATSFRLSLLSSAVHLLYPPGECVFRKRGGRIEQIGRATVHTCSFLSCSPNSHHFIYKLMIVVSLSELVAGHQRRNPI